MDKELRHWDLIYPVRPWTTNAERNWHHYKRAKLVKEWREAFCKLAIEAGIPELEVMFIEVEPILGDRRFQDTAACNPAAKAAIDGLVDAGVVPDDTNQWLKWVRFFPCRYEPNSNGLLIRVIGKPKISLP